MTNTNVPVADVEEPNQPRVGWQAAASRAVETSFTHRLLPTLFGSEVALLRSQAHSLQRLLSASHGTGLAGWSRSRSECCCFVAFTSPSPSQRAPVVAFILTSLATIGQRVLLWGGWVAGVFRSKMWSPGCREAGRRVRTNAFLRDMDLDPINPLDARRLEVVVDGLPLFGRAQLAVYTTLVCPLTRDGAASCCHREWCLSRSGTPPRTCGESGQSAPCCLGWRSGWSILVGNGSMSSGPRQREGC